MKEVRDKWWIKSTIHYLVKWADWFSEYNFYELISHLAGALKAVTSYECKLKCKHKKVQTSDENKNLKPEAASHKWWK